MSAILFQGGCANALRVEPGFWVCAGQSFELECPSLGMGRPNSTGNLSEGSSEGFLPPSNSFVPASDSFEPPMPYAG